MSDRLAPRPEDMAPAESPAPAAPRSAFTANPGSGNSAPRPSPPAPTQNVWNSANANMAAGAIAL